jgi:DNA repair protein RadA/Sms
VARPQSRYVCQACAASTLRWEGQCRSCGEWNTLVETLVREPAAHQRRRRPAATGDAMPVPIGELEESHTERRATGIAELDRVLGGGLVAGSVVLVGGEPGIGKSTLVLEAAAGIAAASGTDATVLYASGEESAGQLRLRAARLGIADGPIGRSVLVLAETDVERILEAAGSVRPALLVVDSVQTIRLDALEGPAGSVGQVRESAGRLIDWAKQNATPAILVGHVTKDGTLAGPKTLEHLVDAVLALEGERGAGLRLLRATKNRFGSTEEIGVFEMATDGLREVPDPQTAFLGRRSAPGPGVAVAATLEGSRPLLVEVQALVAPASYGTPRRTVGGLDPNRLALLVAVLGRRAGLGFGSQDLYVSLAGGLAMSEPALDLPIALALASSWRDRPVTESLVACGEIGLLGELRPVGGLERRLREAARLGYREALVPVGREATPERIGDLRVLAVGTVGEAIERAIGRGPGRAVMARPGKEAGPTSSDAEEALAGDPQDSPSPVPSR